MRSFVICIQFALIIFSFPLCSKHIHLLPHTCSSFLVLCSGIFYVPWMPFPSFSSQWIVTHFSAICFHLYYIFSIFCCSICLGSLVFVSMGISSRDRLKFFSLKLKYNVCTVLQWFKVYRKAECQRTDAFELWCWRRLLRVPWITRRSTQSILKEITSEYSLEGLVLKLKLQYFGHLMRRTNSQKKTLMLGKIEGGRRRGWQRMRWLDGITNSMDMSLSRLWELWWTGSPGMLQSTGLQRIRHDWETKLTDRCTT